MACVVSTKPFCLMKCLKYPVVFCRTLLDALTQLIERRTEDLGPGSSPY